MRKFLIFLLFFSGFLIFLPKIASTIWVKKQLEKHLEDHLGGTISIEKVQLNWFDKQHCENIQWINQSNGIAISADCLDIRANFIDCWKYKEKPLNISVIGTKMACEANIRFVKKKNRKYLEMKFSPINAFLKEGEIHFEPTKIDVTESLQVCTWGKIDLQKNHMDITLGLPPKTLKKMFKAKELPEDFLLEIPVSCKMSSKAIEKKLITYFLKNYAIVTSLQR